MEGLFKKFGDDTTFQYFRSFRRIRVNFSSPSAAAHARIQLHQSHFGETDINCYFAQPVTPIDIEDQHLQPPALTKQFLISPPSSPPVGWAPREEGEPLVNHDLLAAIANLSPGLRSLREDKIDWRSIFKKSDFVFLSRLQSRTSSRRLGSAGNNSSRVRKFERLEDRTSHTADPMSGPISDPLERCVSFVSSTQQIMTINCSVHPG